MTIKTLLTAATLAFVTATSGFAMGCSGEHRESASMSCANGTVYDAATGTCKTISG